MKSEEKEIMLKTDRSLRFGAIELLPGAVFSLSSQKQRRQTNNATRTQRQEVARLHRILYFYLITPIFVAIH